MRLLYLSVSKIPSREANSIHVMKMCQALAQLGHTVTLVAPDVHVGVEGGIANLHAFYGVENCFDIRKLPFRPFKGRGWVYGWEAGRLARSLHVDAAYGRSLHACAVAARAGVPTTWDAHMLTFLQRPLERRLFGWMLGAPTFRRLVVNCAALRRDVLNQVPELADRVIVAHNGADPLADGITPADLGVTGDRPQVGYVGQLYAGKGFEIIRAMAVQAPWADFHVVGGDQRTVETIRRDPLLPGNVRMHGFVAPAQADRLTLAFDVLLAPYLPEVRTAGGGETASWLSPMKVFGYMAAGKPILCSDLPVLREVIEDNRNGLLLPPDDAGAWVTALRRVIDNRAERERLGTTARTDFLARHTWRQRARRVLEGLPAGE